MLNIAQMMGEGDLDAWSDRLRARLERFMMTQGYDKGFRHDPAELERELAAFDQPR